MTLQNNVITLQNNIITFKKITRKEYCNNTKQHNTTEHNIIIYKITLHH